MWFLSQTHCQNHAAKYDCAPTRSISVGSMRICLAITGLAVALSLASPAAADQLSDGTAAYDKRDYGTAFKLLQPLAAQGNPTAENVIGVLYFTGHGVMTDRAAGIAWFQKAADQGEMDAECTLGRLYLDGRAIRQDSAAAMTWFRKAADRSFPRAESEIGRMYLIGDGVPQDDSQALQWFQKAADQGYPTAQAELGRLYAFGRGTPPDYVQARMWIALAAKGGDTSANKYADIIAAKMTPDEISKAQKLAAAWTPATPTQGIVDP